MGERGETATAGRLAQHWTSGNSAINGREKERRNRGLM